MKINLESTVPVYLQVANQIKEDIKEQKLQTGDMIPSDRAYCESLGVSHMTVKKAVDLLVSEGLVIRKKGVGTFIAEPKIMQSLFTLSGFTGDNNGKGNKTYSQVLRFDIEVASSKLCSKLRLEEGDRVINLKRLRMLNDEPVALDDAYIRYECEKYRKLLNHDFENESLYYVLVNECGVELGLGEETIEVSSATDEIGRSLGVALGKPMFYLSRITYSKEKEPVEYVESVYRADKYIFQAVLTAP